MATRKMPKDRYPKTNAALSSVDKIGDAINTGVGNAIGGMIEKVKLGDKQGTGTVPFSQTPAGKKRKYRQSHKGLAANMEY